MNSPNKLSCLCLYCGYRWILEYNYGWYSGADSCAICKERKNIKKTEFTEEKTDVYGYRFSPLFPKK